MSESKSPKCPTCKKCGGKGYTLEAYGTDNSGAPLVGPFACAACTVRLAPPVDTFPADPQCPAPIVAEQSAPVRTCKRCNGDGFIMVSNAEHGGLEKIPCPACVGGKLPATYTFPQVLPVRPTGAEMGAAHERLASKSGFHHPALKAPLYEKCPACHGTRKTAHPAMVDRMKTADGKLYSGPLPVGSVCPVCEDGYIGVGLTVGQVERWRAERELMLRVLVRVMACNNATGRGDGEAWSDVLQAVADALSKLSPADVSAAIAAMKRKS